LRIREKCADCGTKSFSMTYKKNVGLRIVEVETPIEERDFQDLWEVSKERLIKSRYDLNGWEYDFFLKSMKPYFLLVEHEMPEGQVAPDTLPELVQKHLIFEVPLGDIRFSSRKLSDPAYAKDLYKTVLKDFENARSRKRKPG
jgi:hypothetical protein